MRVLVTLSGFNLTAKPSATETLVIPFSDIWQVSFNLTAKPSATETDGAFFRSCYALFASILLLSLRLLKHCFVSDGSRRRWLQSYC